MIDRLRAAVGESDARIIVRNESAIAELCGPMPLKAGEWLTIGVEGQPHIHLRSADVARLRFDAPEDGNVALEAVDDDGARLLRVAFVHTNPSKPDCDRARRAALIDRYGAARGA
jgi:hypothetical protein